MHRLTVNTSSHTQFVNITEDIRRVVKESGLQEGVCHVFVPHTTAGITINENADPDVVRDLIRTTEKLVPWDGDYAHYEGNSAAHLKASMMGFAQTVLISNGDLALGTWQSIYFCEFDGSRTRQVWLQLTKSA